MKKLSILSLSALALGITAISCSDDDSKPATIEGKWTFSTIQALDASGNLTGTSENYPGITGNDASCSPYTNDSMTFKASTNGTYTDHPVSGCTTTDTPFTYAKNGTALSIDLGGTSPLTAEVMSITATELKLKVGGNGSNYQIVLKK